MGISPLIFIDLNYLSGGTKRTYEILKRGYKHKIDYVVVMDKKQLESAVRFFPDLPEVIKPYRLRLLDSSLWDNKSFHRKWIHAFKIGKMIARIAREENVDLLVSPSELPNYIFTSYVAGKISHISWTAVLQSVPIAKNLNTEFMWASPWKSFFNSVGVKSAKLKLIRAAGMLGLLRLLEETTTLSASKSVVYEMMLFDRKLQMKFIDPPNGVDIERINQLEPAKDGFDAFFFARLEPSKGLFDLLYVWKHVVTHNSKLVLGVAGPLTTYVKDFLKLINKISLQKNVVFLGTLKSWDDIVRLAKASKVVLYPSQRDSFSLTVLESLACGVPVVAYDSSALRFHFAKVPAVKMFSIKAFTEMADEINFLIENEKFRRSLGNKAISFAQRYAWDNVVEAELDSYKYVLQQA